MYQALIIDDEKPVRTAVSALGNWQKYDIMELLYATNGEEGLSVMREYKPQLVFVDMRMPVMNGSDFLSAAKKEFPNTQYIVISGYDEFTYAQVAIKNGAIDYLLKPIDGNDLNHAIERAVTVLKDIAVEDVQEEADEGILPVEQDLSPNEVIDIIKEYVEKNFCKDIKLAMFSEQYFFSQKYLSKLFKNKYDIGIYEYALKLRMGHAKELLKDGSLQIQEVSDRLGYSNNNYFSKAFKTYYGISPTEYREQEQVHP